MDEGLRAAASIGYPVVLRPAFTLGGTGGGFADGETELRELLKNALKLSPVHQVLVEKSIKGYKEIEYEVMGGVSSAEDVLEMLLAGAAAVEVGAANLTNPFACRDIVAALPEAMRKYGINDLKEIIGGAH